MVVLQGVLAILVVFIMVKRGAVVVSCVVNVVREQSPLWSVKVRHDFEVYFLVFFAD
jgi:hypothetical protein